MVRFFFSFMKILSTLSKVFLKKHWDFEFDDFARFFDICTIIKYLVCKKETLWHIYIIYNLYNSYNYKLCIEIFWSSNKFLQANNPYCLIVKLRIFVSLIAQICWVWRGFSCWKFSKVSRFWLLGARNGLLPCLVAIYHHSSNSYTF